MWLLLAGLAAAGELRLTPTPGATVELLPSVAPGRTDVIFHHNSADLRAQVREAGEGQRATDGIRSARALDMGGDWVVTIWVMDVHQDVQLVPDGASLRVQLVPRVVELPPDELVVPTLEDLEAGRFERTPCTTRPQALTPLIGRDAIWAFGPRDIILDLPVWSGAEPPEAAWSEIDTVRRELTSRSHEPPELAAILYKLGALHRGLGQVREAAYYFGAAALLHQGDGGLAQVQRAGTLLQTGNWDAAQDAAWAAAHFGAPDEAVLEVLGVVALAGKGLPPMVVGRALLHSSPRPQVQMLAGALLSRDGCLAEALPALRTAEKGLTGEEAQATRLLLADAELMAGDPIEAGSALGRLDESQLRPGWRGMARARGRLIPMLLVTADQWLSSVPGLQRASRLQTVEGAESLWVLGQVYERLGEERSAITTFSELIDRHRALAEGVPGQRLLKVWKERTRQLYAQHRPMDVLGLHTTVWRPYLTAAMQDAGPLFRIADDYAEAGLPERALSTLQDVVDIEGRAGRDTREAAVKVAALYLDLNRPEEALEAAHWLREGGLEPAVALDITRVEALALERTGKPEAAAVAWRKVEPTLRYGSEARVHLALLVANQGDCADAITPLRREMRWLLPNSGAYALATDVLDRCEVALGTARIPDTPTDDPLLAEDAAHAAFLARMLRREPQL